MKTILIVLAFAFITAADGVFANEKVSNENGYEFGRVGANVEAVGGGSATSAGNNVYISLGDGALAVDLTIEQLNTGNISSSAN